ncbi:hypothetical protein HDV03_005324 [Kappamyces sp. JEL0829]|nr:hypothetical protein HDV03_005324 [Kappamyces sp. JEL0829]
MSELNEFEKGQLKEKEAVEALNALEDDDAEKQDAEFSLEYTKGLISAEDDLNTPAFTIRAVFLGVLWAIVLATANTIGSFRANPFILPSNLASILSYPMGIFLAAVLPDFGIGLNPGPFSVKEHVLVYIIAGSAGGQPYGLLNVVGQRLFFGDNNVTVFNSLLWVLATQMTGYGIAGLCRRFLVKPTAMLWPGALGTVAFFNAFHNPKDLDDPNGKYFHSMSRYTAFWFAFGFMFVYQWIPSYFAPALGAVSLLCLFPNISHTVAFLGSVSGGPGILGLSFDWTYVNYTGAVYSPWYTTVNYLVGSVFFCWILGPIWYYTNPFNGPVLRSKMNWGGAPISDWTNTTQNFDPIPKYNANKLYDSTGTRLIVKQGTKYPYLLNMENNLNDAVWDKIGQKVYLSAAFSISYYASFISLGAVISHVALWYGKDVYRQFREALAQTESELYSVDPHYKIMKQYKEVPEWMYLVFMVIFCGLSMIVTQVTPFVMPWWLCIICLITGIVFAIPIGIVQAVTGYQPGLNILTEFIAGLMVPGQTVAVAGFKSMGYDVVIQSLNLTGDLKLGHYMHISPIAMVAAQFIGTLIGVFFNTFVAFVFMSAHPSLDDAFWQGVWNPNGYATFVNAAGIWGALGPARMFGTNATYFFLNSGYLIGLVLPAIPWALNKVYPNESWRKINFILLSAAAITSPTGAAQVVIVMSVLSGFYVQFYLYRYHRQFWDKYAWIICTAFDSAAGLVALATPIFNLFNPNIQSPGDMFAPTWAGPEGAGGSDYYCFGVDYQGNSWQELVDSWNSGSG